MFARVVMLAVLSTLIGGCGSLYPPEAEREISLRNALLDTVDSLDAMKQSLIEKNQRLNVYTDSITAEFYVKGERAQTAKIDATGGFAPPGTGVNLVLQPSYSRTDTGERSNKITIVFKSINNISDVSLRDQLKKCLSDPSCYRRPDSGGLFNIPIDAKVAETAKYLQSPQAQADILAIRAAGERAKQTSGN